MVLYNGTRSREIRSVLMEEETKISKMRELEQRLLVIHCADCWNSAMVEQKLLTFSICGTRALPLEEVTMLVLALVLNP